MNYDLERARQALEYLVKTSYFNQHLERIENLLTNERAQPFTDESELCNELVVIGRQNRLALQNLLDIAKSKRGNKNDYQREFMAAKRKRDRKVIHLEQLITGRALTLDDRRLLLVKQYKIWDKQRTAFLAKIGPVEWEERNAKLKEFWAEREAEIDARATEATTVHAAGEKRQRVKK